ncbi:MAG: hypothetical protein OEZ68_22265 [Gammaproteobacteria bacterium]|nr:hypothetical protein [Gammaproteobacteria bacterium]MDH5803513.1 hypothetical protein [Gammaproteobacteria bacterium]
MTTRNSTVLTITEQRLLDDSSVSFWVKKQIQETKDRDLVDATRDAELLLMILKQRCMESGLPQ